MIEQFTNWILYSVFSLTEGSHLAESLHFFVYDTIKILILLLAMISVVGFLRTYLPQHKIKKWLSGRRRGSGNILAASLLSVKACTGASYKYKTNSIMKVIYYKCVL